MSETAVDRHFRRLAVNNDYYDWMMLTGNTQYLQAFVLDEFERIKLWLKTRG